MKKKAKHERGSRAQADELKYDEGLRREEETKREVICHLRDEATQVYESNARLLESLIHTGDLLVASLQGLRFYRERALAATKAVLQDRNDTHCAAGCKRHEWDSTNGWRKV